MKSIVLFCVIIFWAGQAVAAIKNCEELKSEIAAKLVAAGVSSFVLHIVDKDRTGTGKILGRCEGGTKRIVRLPVASFVPGAGQGDISLPAVTFAYGGDVKTCKELKSEIATKLIAAGISPSVLAIVDKERTGSGKVVGSCEGGTKRIVRLPAAGLLAEDEQGDLPSLPAVTLAYGGGIKDCEELKSEIAAKLVAAGVSSFVLDIVDKERIGAGKIIGSCENGTKRIVRRKDR
ncbi:MAG: DUF1161 domain-containing protein [Candidatus Electrothrix scaldis]|nr:MAG: DUF1161 domain-containing protein [Candidatus Electrothrix sp. GW3-3]